MSKEGNMTPKKNTIIQCHPELIIPSGAAAGQKNSGNHILGYPPFESPIALLDGTRRDL